MDRTTTDSLPVAPLPGLPRRRLLLSAAGVTALALGAPGAALAQVPGPPGFTAHRLPSGPALPGRPVSVLLFLVYGAPLCRAFEPKLSQWIATLPAGVTAERVPYMPHPTPSGAARMFYTLAAMGVIAPLQDALHAEVAARHQAFEGEAVVVDFARKVGLDPQRVLDVYRSYGVTASVQRAERLTRQWGVGFAPYLQIGDSYVFGLPAVLHQVPPEAVYDNALLFASQLVARVQQGG